MSTISEESSFGVRIPLSFVPASSQEHSVPQSASAAQPRYTPPASLSAQDQLSESNDSSPIPSSQSVLLLHGIRQPYQVTAGYSVPDIKHDHELLVRTDTIGLNPIDWKAP
jgi:hypothetical protein